MAQKFKTHLKLKGGDKVRFIPPAPDGEQLGGVTQSERQAIANKLTQPDGVAVGKYFRVASIDIDGKAVLESVDLPITGVSIDDIAVTPDTNGVVGLKHAGENYGLVKLNTYYGHTMLSGYVKHYPAQPANIDARDARGLPITPDNLEYAIRSGLLSNSEIKDADKSMICQTIGAERSVASLEYIETIDVTVTQGVIREVQPDGTPYSFSKICIVVQLPANATSSAFPIYVRKTANGTSYTGTNAYIAAVTSATANTRYALITFQDHGYFIRSQFGYFSAGGLVNVYTYQPVMLYDDTLKDKPMSQIVIQSAPAGVKFHIYGVRK